jgi:hypothetical protein
MDFLGSDRRSRPARPSVGLVTGLPFGAAADRAAIQVRPSTGGTAEPGLGSRADVVHEEAVRVAAPV